tara:strand:- start:1140 stop:2243 length:1104 start_codon:yes stop_codon:yes gene_type:complete
MQNKEFKLVPNFGIMSSPIYKGGEQPNILNKKIIKLNSNENPLGPSKLAIEALRNSFDYINNYPSSNHELLRKAIGKVYNIDFEKITCGAGSDELISFICQCFCSPNDEVIYTEHGFAMYRISAQLRGAVPIKVSETNRIANVDNILQSCNNKTKIIFLANPNNPTGTFLEISKIKYLLEKLPDNILIVIDGAYSEYIENFDSGISFVRNYNNLIVLRTFSKIYGLASLRIGWSYSSKWISKIINQVRGPFNLSSPAIAAAIAAVQDTTYTQHCLTENLRNREWLSKALNNLGLRTTDSKANFLLVDFSSEIQTNKIFDFLRDQSIYVRKVADYGLKKSLRITIGTLSQCKLVKKQIQNFLELNNEI